MGNCLTCKWHRLRTSVPAERRRLGIAEADIDRECGKCLEAFKADIAKTPRVCIDCEWKDRTLPYWERHTRCKACAEAFAERHSTHDCTKCRWNDPVRRMPSDATMEHCKACMGKVGGATARNCDGCQWHQMPEAVRRPHCIGCSMRFAASGKVRYSINELSNKGQTIISYDNHNPNMEDDRDTVTKITSEYTESRKSASGINTVHPAFGLGSDIIEDVKASMSASRAKLQETINGIRTGEDLDIVSKANDRYVREVREAVSDGIIGAYEKMKAFVYEMCQLSDMQVLLLLAEIRGEKKTDFARNHNIKDAAVNMLFKQLVSKSPVFKEFIIMTRGSLKGTRGRKPKDGVTPKEKTPRRERRKVFLGVFQPMLKI